MAAFRAFHCRHFAVVVAARFVSSARHFGELATGPLFRGGGWVRGAPLPPLRGSGGPSASSGRWRGPGLSVAATSGKWLGLQCASTPPGRGSGLILCGVMPPGRCGGRLTFIPWGAGGLAGYGGGNAFQGHPVWGGPEIECLSGGVLLSHTLPSAVPSALEGLASGFGMLPGVSPPP